MKRKVQRACVLLIVLLASACGFQLRGTAELPFGSIYVPDAHQGVALDIKRNIQAGTNTKVVDDAVAAQAILQFTQETREKHILALSGAGRVREFQLRYRVGFRVHDGKGGEFLPPSIIELTRDVTFNDAVFLAKQEEDLLLYRDMQADMVQQIMRRLAAARTPKPE
jgi:LPS-assembly lipoprotein